MPSIEIYDPALCCPTGVCGPSVDPALARFAADLDWLSGQGITVARHNLAQEPGAFAGNPAVAAALAAAGDKALPIVLVDGLQVSAGRHPSREELATWAGILPAEATALPVAQGGCCAPADGPACC